jgi:hypothetical protein
MVLARWVFTVFQRIEEGKGMGGQEWEYDKTEEEKADAKACLLRGMRVNRA